MRLKLLIALAFFTNFILATVVLGQEPQMFRYQGRILDNDALVSGNLNFSFKLYDSPTGGLPLYTDTALVTVVDGLYSTMIGDDTSNGSDLGDALSNSAVYLEIEVGGETLSPRERIVSVPYAMNGLPSGSVVLSTTNPNTALEAQGYSLLYSDVTSREDWVLALQNSLVIPSNPMGSMYYAELVAFGGFVGFLSNGGSAAIEPDPFYYSRDGVVWNESTPPFVRDTYASEEVVLNDTLYLLTRDMDGGLKVASTSNGADWNVPSVSSPIANISSLHEVEAFAGQIWLFGADSPDYTSFILKSSDGATWTAVTPGAWDAMSLETESTPDRLIAVAPVSGGTSSSIWSTTDGTSWTQSSAVLPVDSPYGLEVTFANDALWIFGMPEGGTTAALYKSTNWGDSWAEVSNNLPENIDAYGIEIESLGGMQGLILSKDNSPGGYLYITTNGTDWVKVSDEAFDEVTVSPTGQIWLFDVGHTEPNKLHSIGGPLRSGRLFHYQKN